jgi:hypothetical protein
VRSWGRNEELRSYNYTFLLSRRTAIEDENFHSEYPSQIWGDRDSLILGVKLAVEESSEITARAEKWLKCLGWIDCGKGPKVTVAGGFAASTV